MANYGFLNKINLKHLNLNPILVSIGCFPTGRTYAAFNDGLTKNMTSEISGSVISNSPYLLMNGFYMFRLTSGMTVEACARICLKNKFLFSATGGYRLLFYCVFFEKNLEKLNALKTH